MGLDITYYEHVTLDPAGHEDSTDHVRLYPMEPDEAVADGLVDGYYLAEPSGGFRAGSYIGYNDWRRTLSVTMLDVHPDVIWGHPETFAGKPFVELINFSNCEGVIGPKTSAKLAADFEAHKTKAAALGKRFYRVYENFQRAFEVVGKSSNGAVQFH